MLCWLTTGGSEANADWSMAGFGGLDLRRIAKGDCKASEGGKGKGWRRNGREDEDAD